MADEATTDPIWLEIWLEGDARDVGGHSLLLLAERGDARTTVFDELREVASRHYVSDEITKERLARLGANETKELLLAHLPTTKRARSGDAGEILATEVAEWKTGYRIPVRRLRYRDGREMALRGDDLIGVKLDRNGKTDFLKGEAKSRAAISDGPIDEAGIALDKDNGRPTRLSALFVAERLREGGEDDLASEIEKAVLESFAKSKVEHLLFVLCGSEIEQLLIDHLRKCPVKGPRRFGIGLRVMAHADFVKNLFE